MKYGTSLYHLSDYFLPLKYTTLNISSDEETTKFFFLSLVNTDHSWVKMNTAQQSYP